jgi:hypothetical protein
VAAYTVALIALVSGGDGDDSADAARPLTKLERDVKRGVEGGQPPQNIDSDDVQALRAAKVVSAKCDDSSCDVVYSIAVPGRGRIGLQQVDIVRRVFGNTDVEQLTLKVVRGQPTGPGVTPRAEEETPLSLPLFETKCDRSKAPDVNWKRFAEAQEAFRTACSVRDLFEAGPGAGPGAPGGGGE